MTEPRTEAGRALIEALDAKDPGGIPVSLAAIIRHAVPRIEAEAVASYRARLRERVETLRGYPVPATSLFPGHWTPDPAGAYLDALAVLALLDEHKKGAGA